MEQILIILLSVIIFVLVAIIVILSKKQPQAEQAQQQIMGLLEQKLGNTPTKKELELLTGQMNQHVTGQIQLMGQQVNQLSGSNEQRMEAIRSTMAEELRQLRTENNKSLEEMRSTVGEKLQSTLERRLGESFQQVGKGLEQVHQGLGEMQTLAASVGDLQRLLRNVKIRGTWGEVQLGAILEQILVQEQYAENVAVDPMSAERVEYAIALPQEDGKQLWLPIDAKCPLEDYQRLLDAEEQGNLAEKNQCQNALLKRIMAEAADIRQKYIKPPYTADFAILFLPIEGLYAEVLRQPGFCETLQREQRVLVAGPTTLAALLNVLQLGYKSLAVQERAEEVWQLLGIVKQEFSDFGAALARSQKKIQEAGNALEQASRRTRVMERKLKAVEQAKPLAETTGEAADPEVFLGEQTDGTLV